jgi:hypothetical protein
LNLALSQANFVTAVTSISGSSDVLVTRFEAVPLLPPQDPPLTAVFSCGEHSATRRLLACGDGCLGPRSDAAKAQSLSMAVLVTFSQVHESYATAAAANSVAYAVCYSLGCDYRNVTVAFVTGDTMEKTNIVYGVTFYGENAGSFVDALSARLPSTNVSEEGSVAQGLALPQTGALPLVTGVYAGYGAYAPSACVCLDGYSGYDCLTPPFLGVDFRVKLPSNARAQAAQSALSAALQPEALQFTSTIYCDSGYCQ